MQGLVANLAPRLNTTDGAASAVTGLNSGVNGAVSDSQGFSPLFSSLLSAPAQTEQVPFASQLLNAFPGQELPLEGQFLPPGSASGLTSPGGGDERPELSRQQLLAEQAGALPLDPALLAVASGSHAGGASIEQAIRSQSLPAPTAEGSAVASQLSAQGQSRLQQEIMMRQLALSPSEGGDEELAMLRTTLSAEPALATSAGAQLSTMLRDAMLLKQQTASAANVTHAGAESKVGDSFSSAINSLATVTTEARGSGEGRMMTQASINTPFTQQAGWGEEVGSRVKWMVNSQVQSAELKMNPAHLGPVEVKISVQNDQTSIVFSAQNSSVREALDSAIPRLREMLGDNGMNMVDVDVSDQSFAQQQQASAQDGDNMGDDGADGTNSGDALRDGEQGSGESEEMQVGLSSRVVDFYA